MPSKYGLFPILLALTLPSAALAQNVMLPVQGLLTDADGTPIEGNVTLEFEVVDGSGQTVWDNDILAEIKGGQFSVYLGMGSSLPASIFAANRQLNLKLSIDDEAVGVWPLGSTPYAATALHASNADTLEGQRAEDFAAADHSHELRAGTGLTLDDDGNLALGEDAVTPANMGDAGCEAGQFLKWDGGAWGCASDQVLTQEAVENMARGVAYDNAEELAQALDGRYFQAPVNCEDDQLLRWNGQAWVCGTDQDTQLSQATVEGFARGATYDTPTELQTALDGHFLELPNQSCNMRQLLRWDGEGWTCSNDESATLSEAQVDTMVANNGYVTLQSLHAISTSGSWRNLEDIPADIADGDSDTHLNEAQVDQMVSNNGYQAASDLHRLARTGSWRDLQNIPADIADGDANTQLTEGDVDRMANNNGYARSADLHRVATTGSWNDLQHVPAELADGDDDTTYTAGSGLNLNGTQFTVNNSTIQRRITASCPEGQSIRAIAQNGQVTCEVDTDTDTDTTYSAGNGLTLSNRVFAIGNGQVTNAHLRNGAVTRSKMSQDGCTVGQTLKWSNSGWVCSSDIDTDTNTTYTAGNGLTLVGTQFLVNTGQIQARVTGTCQPGYSIREITTDGRVTCEQDTDTDTNTTYTAGTGLNLTGTTFSVRAESITAAHLASSSVGNSEIAVNSINTNQLRNGAVTRAKLAADGCNSGQVLKYSVSGWVCGNDIDTNTDTNTTYTAGNGLSLSGTQFRVNTNVIQNRVTGSCQAGQSIRTIHANGSVTCEIDTDTDTTYTAGSGMNLSQGAFSVSPSGIENTHIRAGAVNQSSLANNAVITARIADGAVTRSKLSSIGCNFGQILKFRGNGWVCEADVDTDTNTTYSAGSGLRLSGTSFSVANSGVTSNHLADNSVGSSEIQGGAVTRNELASNAVQQSHIASNAVGSDEISNNAVNTSEVAPSAITRAKLARDGCGINQLLKYTNAGWSCANDNDANTQYTAGSGLVLNNGVFAVSADGLTANHLAPNSVTRSELADNAVGSAEIAADAVGSPEIVANAVGASEIAASAVQTSELATGAVTRAKLARDGCNTGQVLKYSNSGWACGEDIDTDTNTNTTYTAGTGLTLSGTRFSVNSSAVQSRVTGSCAPGQSIRSISVDGSVQCEVDDNTDTNTTYTAGSGLSLIGTSFRVGDNALTSSHLGSGSVRMDEIANDAVGSAEIATDAVNSAEIANDAVGATEIANNAVGASEIATNAVGSAEIASNAVNSDELATDSVGQSEIAASAVNTSEVADGAVTRAKLGRDGCGINQVLKYSNSGWSCANDNDANSQYTAGSGLVLNNGEFAIPGDGLTAAHLAPNSVGRSEIADNAVAGGEIAADAVQSSHIGSNAVGSSEIASSAVGNSEIANAAVTRAKLARDGCNTGQVLKYSNAGWICGNDIDTDTNTNTTYTAGTGLSLSGTRFSVNSAAVQTRVTGTCAPGQSIRSIASDGSVQCEVDDNTDTNTTYQAGSGLALTGTTFSVGTNTLTTTHLGRNSVAADELATDSVGSDEITNNAVNSAEIANNAVGSTEIADNAVGSSEIATNAVGSEEIASNAVNSSEIATDAVGSAEIASNAVNTAEVASSAITRAKLARDGCGLNQVLKYTNAGWSCANDNDANSQYTAGTGLTLVGGQFSVPASGINSTHLANDSVGSSEIAASAVGSSELAADSVLASEIAAGAVGNSEIAMAAVSTAKIANGAVSFAKINAGGCTNGQILKYSNTGWVCGTDINTNTTYSAGSGITLSGTTFSIANNALNAGHLATDSVDHDEIATGAVRAAEIATNAVGASEIAANAVGASEIASGAVGQAEIGTGAVGQAEIAANAVNTAEIATGSVTRAKLSRDGCAVGQLLKWSNSGWVCSNDIDNNNTYTAGSGITLSGGTFSISNDSLSAAHLAADSVRSSEIAAGSVGNSEIAANSVDTSKLVNDSVTTAKIATGAVATTDIADGAVTFAKINAGGCTNGQTLQKTVGGWACATPATAPSGNLTGNGYTTFGNGMKMQWGSTFIGLNNSIAVFLPSGYANACLNVSTGARAQGDVYVESCDRTTIRFRSSGYSGAFYWQSIGH